VPMLVNPGRLVNGPVVRLTKPVEESLQHGCLPRSCRATARRTEPLCGRRAFCLPIRLNPFANPCGGSADSSLLAEQIASEVHPDAGTASPGRRTGPCVNESPSFSILCGVPSTHRFRYSGPVVHRLPHRGISPCPPSQQNLAPHGPTKSRNPGPPPNLTCDRILSGCSAALQGGIPSESDHDSPTQEHSPPPGELSRRASVFLNDLLRPPTAVP